MRLPPNSILCLMLAASTASSALALPQPASSSTFLSARSGLAARGSRVQKDLERSESSNRGADVPPRSSLDEEADIDDTLPTNLPTPTETSDESLVSTLFAAYETNMPPSWVSTLAEGKIPPALQDVLDTLPEGAKPPADIKVKELMEKAGKVVDLKEKDSNVDLTDLRQTSKSAVTTVPAGAGNEEAQESAAGTVRFSSGGFGFGLGGWGFLAGMVVALGLVL